MPVMGCVLVYFLLGALGLSVVNDYDCIWTSQIVFVYCASRELSFLVKTEKK